MLAGMRRYLAPLTLFLLLLGGAASAGSLQLLVTHDAVCGDFARWQREIDEIGAYLMVDIAHYAGLVAGGAAMAAGGAAGTGREGLGPIEIQR